MGIAPGQSLILGPFWQVLGRECVKKIAAIRNATRPRHPHAEDPLANDGVKELVNPDRLLLTLDLMH